MAHQPKPVGGALTFAHPAPPTKSNTVPAPPASSNYYLTFVGKGFTSGAQHSFSVLSGDAAPTMTGGYAKWQTIDRPLTRGVTIFQGYDPVQMTVQIRFGTWQSDLSWDVGDKAAIQLSTQIGYLEWMAGSNFKVGPSPVVYVYAYSTQGGQSELIPRQYQNMPWIVTGLQWGEALRNANGYRIRQDATVTLTNYLNFLNPPTPDNTTSGGYFVSKPGADTALLIARAPSSHAPPAYYETLAKRIIADPKNAKLKLRGIKQAIRHHKNVWVPAHVGSV